MARRDGRLVVSTPDGRRVWGAADAAFRDGVAGLGSSVDDGRVAGVHPLDTVVARRPAAAPPPVADVACGADSAPTTTQAPASITRLLFPDQRPDLPDSVHVNGEPVDLAYVVGVLLANRDLERRLAAGNAGDTGRLAAVA